MVLLQGNVAQQKQFIINDHGKLITIKQPNIVEINLLYKVILANIIKNRINKINFINIFNGSP